ncbi:MAG: SURF1 family protein [Pseudomonadota bacterium]
MRSINWRVTAFTVVFFIVFVRLGFWQLDREDEKVALLEANAEAMAGAPVGLAELEALDRGNPQTTAPRVVLHGRWENRWVLLDNRILDGRAGYEVLQLFRDASIEQPVLINRGYVSGGPHRLAAVDILFDASVTPGLVSIIGIPRFSQEAERVWLGSETMSNGVPLVQMADAEQIGRVLSEPVYPVVIRLDEKDPMALPRHWPVTVMAPEMHRGYAVQWFLMAFAIVVMWGVFTWQQWRPQDEPRASS